MTDSPGHMTLASALVDEQAGALPLTGQSNKWSSVPVQFKPV